MASAKEAAAVEAQDTEITNEVIDAAAHLGVRRYFTIPGRAPFDEVEWEIRDATIPGKNGPAFEQKDVEFPKFWSQTATNIVAQKYFRGRLSSPDRERSVKQMIGRVVDTVVTWGRAGGYFADDEEAQTFEDELSFILVHEVPALAAPARDRVDHPADHLAHARLALGRGHAAAEVLLRDDVRRGLAPELRELDALLLEHRAVLARDDGIADLPLDLVERVAAGDREVAANPERALLRDDGVTEGVLGDYGCGIGAFSGRHWFLPRGQRYGGLEIGPLRMSGDPRLEG